MHPETKLKRKVVRELRKIPCTSWHVIDQESLRGDPDIMGCALGLFYGIEIKVKWENHYSDRERLQRYKLAKIIKAGGAGIFIFEDNWKWQVNQIRKRVEASLQHLKNFAMN